MLWNYLRWINVNKCLQLIICNVTMDWLSWLEHKNPDCQDMWINSMFRFVETNLSRVQVTIFCCFSFIYFFRKKNVVSIPWVSFKCFYFLIQTFLCFTFSFNYFYWYINCSLMIYLEFVSTISRDWLKCVKDLYHLSYESLIIC